MVSRGNKGLCAWNGSGEKPPATQELELPAQLRLSVPRSGRGWGNLHIR